MKGTILDFLKLVGENEELRREIGELAAKHDFEFIPTEELSEEELGNVAGGLSTLGTILVAPLPPQPPTGTGGGTDVLPGVIYTVRR